MCSMPIVSSWLRTTNLRLLRKPQRERRWDRFARLVGDGPHESVVTHYAESSMQRGVNALFQPIRKPTEELIAAGQFWSEITMTIIKLIALGLASLLIALVGCSKSQELDPRTQP